MPRWSDVSLPISRANPSPRSGREGFETIRPYTDDGYSVLREVRQVEPVLGRRVPVAAVSAYAHAEDRQRAIAAGFDHYLAKPVDPAALAAAVKALRIASTEGNWG
jgi:CheY-like chemotaxis protein